MTWLLVAVVVAWACLHGWLFARRFHRYLEHQRVARLEREGLLAHLDWHAQHSHGGWRS